MPRIDVQIVSNQEQREQAYNIRRRVFRDEQHVAEGDEFDADDDVAFHALALVDGRPAGTARLVLHPHYAKVGRMAVILEARRSGVGRAILDRLIAIAAERGATHLLLHAQVHAIPFYTSAGFQVTSEVFEEAGIPHRRMERPIQT